MNNSDFAGICRERLSQLLIFYVQFSAVRKIDKQMEVEHYSTMGILLKILESSWTIFQEAALYLLFGFVVAGILHAYIRTDSVVKYLHKGRFRSVFYSSLLGIPIPLCSCGVVPAVAGFKRQGANNGSCLSFLTSTPETGVDSIALTYSLLGPVMTLMRPITAFITAMCAGLLENFTGRSYSKSREIMPDRICVIDACCDGSDCDPWAHARHHTFVEKLQAGMRFAFKDLMADLAVWFVLGILLAGIISALIPESIISAVFGSGILAYLGALVISGPMYVCATLSTPVAAALVVKGMSPGAALVFLMAGPATNMPTITMVVGLLGKRSLGIYLGSIAICSLIMAFATDWIFQAFDISIKVSTAAGEEVLPWWVEAGAALILAVLIARVLWRKISKGNLPRWLPWSQASNESPPTTCCCETDRSGVT